MCVYIYILCVYILLLWCRMVLVGFAKPLPRHWNHWQIQCKTEHLLEAPKTWIRGKGKKHVFGFIYIITLHIHSLHYILRIIIIGVIITSEEMLITPHVSETSPVDRKPRCMLAIRPSAFVGFEDAEGQRPSAPAPATKRNGSRPSCCVCMTYWHTLVKGNHFLCKVMMNWTSPHWKGGLKQQDDDDGDGDEEEEVASMSQVKGSPVGRQGLLCCFWNLEGSWGKNESVSFGVPVFYSGRW